MILVLVPQLNYTIFNISYRCVQLVVPLFTNTDNFSPSYIAVDIFFDEFAELELVCYSVA